MLDRVTVTAALCAAALASCSTDGAALAQKEMRPAPMDGIERQQVFGDIYLASQPSAAALRAARERGLRTVVNLRPASEQTDLDEAALVRELGAEYHNPGFASPEQLSDEIFAETRALLADPAKRPLMMHCASANRVGAIWLAYRVLDAGVSFDEALAEAHAVGLRSPALEKRAADYIAAQGG